VSRVTAADMAKGLGGWSFADISFEEGKFASMVIMTMKPERPDGHVGMLTDPSHMVHASSTRGFIKVEVSRTAANHIYFKITKLKKTS
jgi:hypothetical protein